MEFHGIPSSSAKTKQWPNSLISGHIVGFLASWRDIRLCDQISGHLAKYLAMYPDIRLHGQISGHITRYPAMRPPAVWAKSCQECESNATGFRLWSWAQVEVSQALTRPSQVPSQGVYPPRPRPRCNPIILLECSPDYIFFPAGDIPLSNPLQAVMVTG